MSVFASLSREHALLLELVRRLEKASVADDAVAVRDVLLVMLDALEVHEKLERLVFDEAPIDGDPAALRARELIDRQHEVIDGLRSDARELLAGAGGADAPALGATATRLAALLRRHFEDEERRLWPVMHGCLGRSALSRLERSAREHARNLERQVVLCWAAVRDYLSER